MAEYLVIRLGTLPQAEAEWMAVDSTGSRLGQPARGPLSAAAAEIGERSTIVLVPSAEVLTTSVDIPVKGAKLMAALPFALEEYLAEDVEDLHFAAGARRGSGRTPACVVSRQRMDEWLATLDEAGIEADSIVAENYGLPRIPGTISLLLAEDQVFINDGADIELAMQGVSPGDALAAIGALDESAEDETISATDAESAGAKMPRHALIYCEPENDERYQHDWIALRHELESVDVKILPDGVMPRLAVTVATGTGINLLQGDYARRREYGGLLRPWKNVAMLLIALGVVSVVAKAADYYRLTKLEADLQQTFNAEYQAVVPGAPATDNPEMVIDSLRRRIGNVETPPVFLQSLESIARALQQNREAEIQAISFRGGAVDIRVVAPNVSILDNLQRVIGEGGRFRAAIQATDQDGDKVNSRIQIQAVGS